MQRIKILAEIKNNYRRAKQKQSAYVTTLGFEGEITSENKNYETMNNPSPDLNQRFDFPFSKGF